MSSKLAPIDLSDDIAVRRFLQDPKVGTGSSSGDGSSSYEGSFTPQYTMSNASIQKYIQAEVKAFDDAMQRVIDEVEFNLAGTNYRTVLLESNLANNYATITEIAGTYATSDVVGAIYGIEVNASGHVSGYKSVATGETSIFKIYADKFAVSSTATNEAYSPFQIDTVNHKINMTANVAINGNLLTSGSITATKLGIIGVGAFVNDANFTTLTAVANQGYVLPAGVANAINTNTTTINGAKITTGTIAAAQIAANTITADKIASNTITATQISSSYVYAGTISASNITTGTLNADRITSGSLTTSSRVSFSNTNYTGTVASITTSNTSGTSNLVFATLNVAFGSITDYVRVFRDGTLLKEWTGAIGGGSYSFVYSDVPGSYTYTVQVRLTDMGIGGDIGSTAGTFSLVQLKK